MPASAGLAQQKDAPQGFFEPPHTEKSASAAGLNQNGDAPAYFNEPAFTEKMPAAAGLAQQKDAPSHFNEPAWTENMPSAGGYVLLNDFNIVSNSALAQNKAICTGFNSGNCIEPSQM